MCNLSPIKSFLGGLNNWFPWDLVLMQNLTVINFINLFRGHFFPQMRIFTEYKQNCFRGFQKLSYGHALDLFLISRLNFNWSFFFLRDFFSFIFYHLKKGLVVCFNPGSSCISALRRARKGELEMPHNLLYMSRFHLPGVCYGTFLCTTRSLLGSVSPAFTDELPLGILPCEDLTRSTALETTSGLISDSYSWHLHWLPTL